LVFKDKCFWVESFVWTTRYLFSVQNRQERKRSLYIFYTKRRKKHYSYLFHQFSIESNDTFLFSISN